MALFGIRKLWNLLKECLPITIPISIWIQTQHDCNDDEPEPESNCQQLPKDMWQKVFEYLDFVEIVLFSSVCKEFRSIATHYHPLPCISNVLLVSCSLTKPNELMFFNFKDMREYKIQVPKTIETNFMLCKGASFGYLIFQNIKSHEIIVWNPISNNQISLPPIVIGPIKKFTLSCKPITRKEDNFMVIICIDSTDTIYFCKPEEKQWKQVKFNFWKIDDILYHNNRLYVIDNGSPCYVDLLSNPKEIVWCMDIEREATLSDNTIKELKLGKNYSFAKSSKGELLLIHNVSLSNDRFIIVIIKLNEERNIWKLYRSLGDEDYIFLDLGTGYSYYKGDTICLPRGENNNSEFMVPNVSKAQDCVYFTNNNSCFGRFDYNMRSEFKSFYIKPPRAGNFCCWLAPNLC